MLIVSDQRPEVKAFVYLDSDALVTSNYSMVFMSEIFQMLTKP